MRRPVADYICDHCGDGYLSPGDGTELPFMVISIASQDFHLCRKKCAKKVYEFICKATKKDRARIPQ